MIRVSQAAKVTLKLLLEALVEERVETDPGFNRSKQDIGLRLFLSPSQNITFGLDHIRPGDEVVQFEGANVLLVDKEMSRVLAGSRLDCVDTPAGPRLTVSR